MRWSLLFIVLLAPLARAANPAAAADFERQVAAAVQGPQVTVVHLWAPWCPNCKAELANGGWRDFIQHNPRVKFLFITIWNDADGHQALARAGVGGQANFSLLLHPNPSRKRADQVTSLLGLPITWIPTTWVFQGGKMRYALNYGELHFPILQQLIADSTNDWNH